MNYRKQAIIALLVSIYVGLPERFGLCIDHDIYCVNSYGDIAGPLFSLAIPVLLVVFILLFTREEVYKSWRRFAIWAIPISIIILWIAPTSTPGGWISGGDFTKETASWGVSVLFLIISLVIIIKKSLNGSTTK